MSIVIGETLLALSNVSMNYVNGTEKQVKENAKFSDQLGTCLLYTSDAADD